MELEHDIKKTWSFFLPISLILRLQVYKKKTGVNASFFTEQAIREKLDQVELEKNAWINNKQ